MVIKKKRTYKKQKGGEPITQIARIMIQFFDLIQDFIIINSVALNKDNIIKLYKYIDKKIKYSLFLKLSLYLKGIIDDIDTNTHDTFSLLLIKYLLLEPEITDKFIHKFLKIYIHLLFITYLFKEENFSFRQTILTLLLEESNRNNKLIASFLKMSNRINGSPRSYIDQLQQQLHNLFLHDYSRQHGIPVFYGGLLFDSQYNEFVCRQVGASSNKKRNFIINPVLALAYHLFYKLIRKEPEIKEILKIINRLSKIDQSTKKIIDKINYYLMFKNLIKRLFIENSNQYAITKLIEFVIKKFTTEPETVETVETRENYFRRIRLTADQKLRNKYDYLCSNIHVPKLGHVNPNSQFCIALNQFGEEEIIQPSTFSKCAWKYGCNLKMTPVIREENISSIHDILSLAQILLLIVLTHGDNIFIDISNVQDFLVDKYINLLFYNTFEGRRINNRNNKIIRSKINELDINKIKKLVERLSILYKYFLIQKINILSINPDSNISEINIKLEMIINELRKFKFKFNFDYFKSLHDFLSKEEDNICNNGSKRIIENKKYYFRQELKKIERLIT
jgi:hypothetical protein